MFSKLGNKKSETDGYYLCSNENNQPYDIFCFSGYSVDTLITFYLPLVNCIIISIGSSDYTVCLF